MTNKKDRISSVILSNMCLIYKKDKILVINRLRNDWPGLSFPGGHVENNETLIESVIREMKEETGLFIKNPRLVDIKEWPWGKNLRYLAFLYVTNEFEGEIKSSKEGEIFWINESEIDNYSLSTDFLEIFNMMKKGMK